VRAVPVVMPGVVGQHDPQMLLAEDQHPVGTFTADGADPTFGDRVRPRCLRRRLDDLDADRSEHVVETGGELGVAVTDEEPQPVSALVQINEQIPGPAASPTRRSGWP
jgi:hypothetical protein